MPYSRRIKAKKTYTVCIDQSTHERISKLSMDTGLTRQQLALTLLNVAMDALGNSLQASALEQRIAEMQLRKQWINGLKDGITAKLNPDIITL